MCNECEKLSNGGVTKVVFLLLKNHAEFTRQTIKRSAGLHLTVISSPLSHFVNVDCTLVTELCLEKEVSGDAILLFFYTCCWC